MSVSDLVVPPDTVHRQRRAANPAASAWVSANAGAGKTKVLTDRVIRLLLAGTAPSRILCLTFTKAAAAEMTIRIFKQLGRWVTLDAASLSAALETLVGEKPSRVLAARARRLFAQAVETPGGLKIETIHAFCERVLHLVPFEANVPARFAVLDESQTAELLAEARARVLTEASVGGPRSAELARALDVAARYAAGDGLIALIDSAVLDDRVPADPEAREGAMRALGATLEVAAGTVSDDIRRTMLDDGFAVAARADISAELRRTGKSSDAAQAASLEAAHGSGSLETRLAAYRSIFFTEKGESRKAVATKGVAQHVCATLSTEQDRLVALADDLAAVETVERTEALYVLAGAVRREAEAQKRRLGALDFADLIGKTLALLERDAAAWVLYKLDRGIDHVLVDEAQDTNPDQWRILKLLTEEFTAGAGRPVETPRTLFAVGDPKQSIYSFQKADPRWFEDGRRHWMRLTEAADLRFEDVRLDLSFRSAKAILDAVDHTFRPPAHAKGLSFDADLRAISHASARPDAPGHVEIWPSELKREGAEDPDAWTLPLDEPERTAPPVVVAARIARAVKCWTTAGDDTGRVWRPDEILILVRTRGPAFFAVIRALKSIGVPVAGADRFDIGEHIAVNDLVAAGAAALLPRNDLALASALKSPLVGLDDDDLIRIAAGRPDGESLADAVARCAAGGDAKAGAARAALDGWRDLAGQHGPFGFYATLLGPGGGRRRLVERLGHEAADAIDAFLNYAQAAEYAPETPSLTSFLARFESGAHTIKRDLDSNSGEVRVMTVHGAKGLEAPLVVVIDGCETSGPDPALVPLDTGGDEPMPVWSPGRKSDCGAVGQARESAKDLRLEEHNRLLYVAMTRARDRLVVAPFAARGGEAPAAWCGMIRAGFAEASQALVRTEMPYGPVDLWRGDVPFVAGAGQEPPGPRTARPDLPEWLTRPVEAEPDTPAVLRPSSAVAQAEPIADGPARADRRRRGLLVHALLDEFAGRPPEEADAAAQAFMAARGPGLPEAVRADIVRDALAILRHPALALLFGPGSRGEAPMAGTVSRPAGPRQVSGQVDRMVVTDTEVIVAEFKTGAREPGDPVPQSYLAQLALYRALLTEAYPGRAIRPILVWAAGPEIVEPDAAELDRAFARATGGSA